MAKRVDEVIQSLLLVRLGQELGQAGQLAEAVRDFLDGLLSLVR